MKIDTKVQGGMTLDALYKLARKMELSTSIFEEIAPMDMDELPDAIREILLWRIALLNETGTLFTAIATYYDRRRLTQYVNEGDYQQVCNDLKSIIERGFLDDETQEQTPDEMLVKNRVH